MKRGKFIVIDGLDGSGKSTQVKLLVSHLRKSGYRVCVVREPGSTPIGEKVRRILLDAKNHAMTPATELFLYMASRAQLVAQVIAPALRQGKIVLADRFLSSTIAYQGYGGYIDRRHIKLMGDVAIGDCQPDLTVILDIQPAEGLRRISKSTRQSFDRIEQKQLAFHQKVRKGFREIAKRYPKTVLINAALPVDTIHKQIKQFVTREVT